MNSARYPSGVQQSAPGPGQPSIAKDEIVVSFFLPARPKTSGDAYLRFTPRTEISAVRRSMLNKLMR